MQTSSINAGSEAMLHAILDMSKDTSKMFLLVVMQVGGVSECNLTSITCVRLLLHVDSYASILVHFKILFFDKCFVTGST